MTLKKKHFLQELNKNEATFINDEFDNLYRNKIQSRFSTINSSTATEINTFQAIEVGCVNFSSTGSATVVRTFTLQEEHSVILCAQASARRISINATVTDVTNSSIEVTIDAPTASDISDVTTDTIMVDWSVIGAGK